MGEIKLYLTTAQLLSNKVKHFTLAKVQINDRAANRSFASFSRLLVERFVSLSDASESLAVNVEIVNLSSTNKFLD